MKFSSFQDVEDIKFKDICYDHAPVLNINLLCAIASIQSGPNFSEESIPTDIILTVVNLITCQAVTPTKQAFGKFTCPKPKKMDTWKDWEADERKKLNQFHDLQMFGNDIEQLLEEDAVIL